MKLFIEDKDFISGLKRFFHSVSVLLRRCFQFIALIALVAGVVALIYWFSPKYYFSFTNKRIIRANKYTGKVEEWKDGYYRKYWSILKEEEKRELPKKKEVNPFEGVMEDKKILTTEELFDLESK
ncbi:MAG: hypothetical protein KJ674_05990 [Nanoarchaeota archaeon]|nr:hypothetical protein [Nanoarchaeota archaeon]